MKNNLKAELWKLLHNPMLYLALAIGALFVLMEVRENAGLMQEFLSRISTSVPGRSKAHTGYSLFALSMPYFGCSMGASLYYFFWPILAAMPFGWSYLQERRSGAYDQLVIRSSPRTYFLSKFISVFIGGGLVTAGVFAFDMLANAMVVPYALISPKSMLSPIDNISPFSELFFTCPWAHAAIWCGINFLYGGMAASLCFLVGTKLRFQVLVTLVPFVLFFLIDFLYHPSGGKVVELSPRDLLRPALLTPTSGWVVFSVLGALTALSFGVGYWQVVKHELA